MRAFPREDVRWGCARVHVYTFTKLHDRSIPKVRVGVGPMEFKLNTPQRRSNLRQNTPKLVLDFITVFLILLSIKKLV